LRKKRKETYKTTIPNGDESYVRKTAPIAITSCQQYIVVGTAGSTSPTFPFPKTLAVMTLLKRKRGKRKDAK